MTLGQFFKWSLTSLNSEFSFSKTYCHSKVKHQSALLFTHSWTEKIGCILFPSVLALCENANSLFQDLNFERQCPLQYRNLLSIQSDTILQIFKWQAKNFFINSQPFQWQGNILDFNLFRAWMQLFFTPTVDEYLGRLGSLALVSQLREGKLNSNHLKIDLVVQPACGGDVGSIHRLIW